MRDIQPLIEYVQQNRTAGVSDEENKTNLLQDGSWSEEEVLSALANNNMESKGDTFQVASNSGFNYKFAVFGVIILIVIAGGAYAAYYFTKTGSEGRNNVDPVSNEVNIEENDLTAPYSVAMTQNVPYLCKYSADSFFDEKDYFEAHVLGNDFYSEHVPSPQDLERQDKYGIDPMTPTRFAKKDGWAYLWLESQDGGFKFNYDEVEKYIKKQDATFTSFQEPGLLVEPSADDDCERIEEADILMPNIQFTDVTDQITSGAIPLVPRKQLSFGNTIYGYQFVVPEGWSVLDSNPTGQEIVLANSSGSSSDDGSLGPDKIIISITNFEGSYFDNVTEVNTEEKVVQKISINDMPGVVRIENNTQKGTIVAFMFEFGAEKNLTEGVDEGKIANGIVITLVGDVQEELLVNLASSFVPAQER